MPSENVENLVYEKVIGDGYRKDFNKCSTFEAKPVPTEIKIEQCTPLVVRMDLQANDTRVLVWQELVDELKVNSNITANILCLIM